LVVLLSSGSLSCLYFGKELFVLFHFLNLHDEAVVDWTVKVDVVVLNALLEASHARVVTAG